MAIDIQAVRAQQRELNMVSDEVLSVRRRLERHQGALDEAWKGAEIRGIDAAIEDIVRRLNRLALDLEDLGHDVMAVGDEIRAEEEAEAKRLAEEARRRAAAEEAKRRAEEAEAEDARRRAEEAEDAEEARRRTEAAKAEQEQVLAAISRIFQKGNTSWRK